MGASRVEWWRPYHRLGQSFSEPVTVIEANVRHRRQRHLPHLLSDVSWFTHYFTHVSESQKQGLQVLARL